ncbi:hypothetical protein N476_22620 [Pseudoalteromonas luteoviolacea H33]|uniref:Uncharacterized protein n=1 Tax=Pseudoalteromonas luteoviolacea H33 TaxID=1365251 RepID=A0A167CTE3_9GAMM|nr:hypothetical protein N476_22620 [Pseudoalteromonas luteoviolacea H33]KZN73824.1 hypothetical protein N477_22980 [Pseudoalteromonas luteoviolacea H33-S]
MLCVGMHSKHVLILKQIDITIINKQEKGDNMVIKRVKVRGKSTSIYLCFFNDIQFILH